VIVNITTTDGKKFSKQLDYPKGDPRNPLSDAEIEEKFRALAGGVLSARAQDKLIDAIWNLEKCASVTKLMALMKADVKKRAKTAKRKARVAKKASKKRR
jgi:2-methylcitrate dehydratase